MAYSWTIPDCSKNKTWYVVVLSFTMSIVWIAVTSFALVTIVARTGCILEIDAFTMGLVVIAVGTSIPVSYLALVKLLCIHVISGLHQLYPCG